MSDESDQFTSYIDSINKAPKRSKQSPNVIDDFASILKDSISPDSTFITINNKTIETDTETLKQMPEPIIQNIQEESNLGISEAHELGLNGIKVIEVECDNLEDLGETFGVSNYKNLDKTIEEVINDKVPYPESTKDNLSPLENETLTSHTLPFRKTLVKSDNQQDSQPQQQKQIQRDSQPQQQKQIQRDLEKENQNNLLENKFSEELNDEEIINHLKTIDFLIKKNSDQKTIKSLELQLTEQKEKEKNHKNQQETLNKQIKELTSENNELKRENEILKILSKEIHKKEDTNSKGLKENYEILEALEVGREKLEFLKQSYEIEKQNFQLDISDLKREIIRVNRDNVFLKTVVKELSLKLDQNSNTQENE